MPKQPKKLRSQQWFGLNDRDGFIHRSWMKNQGFPQDVFEGRPVVWHLQHVVGVDTMQPSLPEVGRTRKARHLGERWVPSRVPRHEFRGNTNAPNDDAV